MVRLQYGNHSGPTLALRVVFMGMFNYVSLLVRIIYQYGVRVRIFCAFCHVLHVQFDSSHLYRLLLDIP